MRRYRAARSSRARQATLTGQLQQLRSAGTHAARLRVVDEIAATFTREGGIGEAFHSLLTEARQRGNHQQQLRLLSDFVLVMSTAATCSDQAATTVDGTLQSIQQAAGNR